MSGTCTHEADLLDALAARRWPDRADPALQAHVRACGTCADVAVVASAFFEDRHAWRDDGPLPPASTVWWRSQLRAREEAARRASRPMVAVQIAATACAAIASVLAAPSASAWLGRLLDAATRHAAWPAQGDPAIAWVLGAAAYTTFPLVAIGMWIVLAPVIVYLVLDE